MNNYASTLALLGRILIALIFVLSGWGKITGFAGTAGMIASKGLPMPEVLAGIAAAIEFLGGIALMVGFRARWAALLFAIFLIVISPIFHNFWAMEGAQRMANQINFMKNVSILGAMLMVIAFGPGRYSIDKA